MILGKDIYTLRVAATRAGSVDEAECVLLTPAATDVSLFWLLLFLRLSFPCRHRLRVRILSFLCLVLSTP